MAKQVSGKEREHTSGLEVARYVNPVEVSDHLGRQPRCHRLADAWEAWLLPLPHLHAHYVTTLEVKPVFQNNPALPPGALAQRLHTETAEISTPEELL